MAWRGTSADWRRGRWEDRVAALEERLDEADFEAIEEAVTGAVAAARAAVAAAIDPLVEIAGEARWRRWARRAERRG